MQGHTTVLLHEAVEGLSLSPGNTVVDATLGLGGHSVLLADIVGAGGVVVGIAADQNAIDEARSRLATVEARVHLINGNFRDLATHLSAIGFSEIHGALFDLGWNSTQLNAGRGFSFKSDDPLVMTLDAHPEEGRLTAHTIVNQWSERDLADIIRTLGEEKFAGRIARVIVEHRKKTRITRAN